MNPRRQLTSLLILFLMVFSALHAERDAEVFSGVPFEVALREASALASHNEGRRVVQLVGESMLPYFGPGSVGIVQKIELAEVKPGMILVYRNDLGQEVAHRVVAAVGGAWQVKGYNNERPDTELVDGSNLSGVLYATFNTAGADPAAREAAARGGVDFVWGAPAR